MLANEKERICISRIPLNLRNFATVAGEVKEMKGHIKKNTFLSYKEILFDSDAKRASSDGTSGGLGAPKILPNPRRKLNLYALPALS